VEVTVEAGDTKEIELEGLIHDDRSSTLLFITTDITRVRGNMSQGGYGCYARQKVKNWRI
jgi:hypothetical protein